MAVSGDETTGQLLLQLLERRAGRRSYYCDSGYTSSNHSRQTSFGERRGTGRAVGDGVKSGDRRAGTGARSAIKS